MPRAGVLVPGGLVGLFAGAFTCNGGICVACILEILAARLLASRLLVFGIGFLSQLLHQVRPIFCASYNNPLVHSGQVVTSPGALRVETRRISVDKLVDNAGDNGG